MSTPPDKAGGQSNSPPPSYAEHSKAEHVFSAITPKDVKEKDGKLPPPPPIDPATHLPSTFRIKRSYVPPVVTVPEILDHLTFLSCLHRLQEDVRDAGDENVPGDVKWAAFCMRAAVRFEQWAMSPQLTQVADGGVGFDSRGNSSLDPQRIEGMLANVDIDILMAWHTYMLNPRAYAEDMEREGLNTYPDATPSGRLRGLFVMGKFPLALVARRIDPVTFVYQPYTAGEQEAPPPSYESHPLELVEMRPMVTTVQLRCPDCRHLIDLPLIGHDTQPGFISEKMEWTCPNPDCCFPITHEALRVYRLLEDLKDVQMQRIRFLAGLGADDQSQLPAGVPHEISKALVKGTQLGVFTNEDAPIDTVRGPWNVNWSMDLCRERIVQSTVKEHRLLVPMIQHRLLGNYTTKEHRQILARALTRFGRIYAQGWGGTVSIDLGAAIQRQAAFVGNMENIGWLDLDRFRNPDDPNRYYLLQKAAARYHAFLDLMAANRKAFLSPTLDIDLCWHTHQLGGKRYAYDTKQYVGRFIDHDDKVADVALKRAFDKTATLWAKRFHTEYSGCGCPVSFGAHDAIESVVRKGAGTPLKFWKRTDRVTKIAGARANIDQLTGSTHEERGASCPSTHNRVRVEGATVMDRQRKLTFSDKQANGDHPDPFTTHYEFVPRKVPLPGRRRSSAQPASSSRNRAPYSDPYWGVAPYTAYGPYGLTSPWIMPMGIGGGVGMTGCAVGVGGCDVSGNCAGGTMCGGGAGGGMCDSLGGGGCSSVGAGCGGGGGGAGCGGGGGGGGCGGGGGGCGGGGGGGS